MKSPTASGRKPWNERQKRKDKLLFFTSRTRRIELKIWSNSYHSIDSILTHWSFGNNNKVCLNAFLPQVFAACSSIPWLNIKFTMKTLQCTLRDVHTPSRIGVKEDRIQWHFYSVKCVASSKHSSRCTACKNSPRYTSSLHFVGHCDICGPDIILPALLSQNTTKNCPRMHPNTHVNICLRLLSNVAEINMLMNRMWVNHVTDWCSFSFWVSLKRHNVGRCLSHTK